MQMHDPKISTNYLSGDSTSLTRSPVIMTTEDGWIDCNKETILEEGLLPWQRLLGQTINFIAGAYIVKEAVLHPYTGGVLHMDWAKGNLQESPKVLANYFKDSYRGIVWWSEKRHEPANMAEIAQQLGLGLLDRVYAMSFETSKLLPYQRPVKWSCPIASSPKELLPFFNLMRAIEPWSSSFIEKCTEQMRQIGPQRDICHHIGYYKGKAVAKGSFCAMAQYGFISHLGVHPKMRGHGFGALMLDDLIACAFVAKLRWTFAFVPESVKGYFEKYGFKSHFSYDVWGDLEAQRRFESLPLSC